MSWVPLLLADPSPCLRRQVLRDLLKKPDNDPEVIELTSLLELDPLVQDLLNLQNTDGSWRTRDGVGDSWRNIRNTANALIRLGYFDIHKEHPAVRKGVEYLFKEQQSDGSWPLPASKAEREFREPYTMIPLQTAIPLYSLAAVGYATDPRSEKAYEWLIGVRLEDGAWPSGKKAEKHVFPAGYRRLANSRFGCRSNTTYALCALAYHPHRRESPHARSGLDILLAQETYNEYSLGVEVARMVGVEKQSGFFTYFARNDPALLLDLCWRVKANLEDERVRALFAFVVELQGQYGLWETPSYPRISRWLSYDLLRSLSRINESTDWVSSQPRTIFQPYPKGDRRY